MLKKRTNRGNKLKALSRIQRISIALIAIAIGAAISAMTLSSYAATNSSVSLYLTPATGTYQVNSTVSLNVEVNSGTTGLTGVNAVVDYPKNLTFTSVSLSGDTAFTIPAPGNGNVTSSGGGGVVTTDVFTTTAVPGTNNVATINFTANAAGSAAVTLASTSQIGDSTGTISTPALTGANLTIPTPTCPSGQTGTPPNCVTPAPVTCPSGQTGTPPNCVTPTSPPPTSTGTGSTGTGTTTSTSTGITPKGSTTPVPVSDGSTVKISAPATVQPVTTTTSPTGETTVSTDTTSLSSNSNYGSIIDVEYLLNNKVLANVKTPPYTYRFNTKNTLNGTYTFTTKTYYSSGKVTTSSQKLVVNNPISFTQFRLATEHYSLPVLMVLIIIVIALLFIFRDKFTIWRRLVTNRMAPVTQNSDDVVVSPNQSTDEDGNTIIKPNDSDDSDSHFNGHDIR